jgi:hypothetical protein
MAPHAACPLRRTTTPIFKKRSIFGKSGFEIHHHRTIMI